MKRHEAWVTLIAAMVTAGYDRATVVYSADETLDILEAQPAFEGWDGERKEDGH